MKTKALLILLLAIYACTPSSTNNATHTAQLVDNILEGAEELTDSIIYIKGHVTHTCKHSGRRCFIIGSNDDLSIRVEAGGKITGFDRELEGHTIIVKGILKERRLSTEYINDYEEQLKEQAISEDGSAESCSSEMKNINDMRAWMKEKGKDYYAIYYLDGMEYEIVE